MVDLRCLPSAGRRVQRRPAPYSCDSGTSSKLALQPAHCHRQTPGSKPAQTPGGGNLARAQFTRAGLFSSSTQAAKQLKADFSDVNEAGFSSLPASGTGAAINRLHDPAAKSRPLPLSFQAFVEVDHISHCRLLSDLKPIRTSFRDGGIFIREGR